MAGTWAWSIALFVFSLEKPLWKCATCFRQCVVCLGTPYYHSRDQDIDLELTDQDDEYSVQEISRRVGRTKAVLYTLCALPLIMEWSTLLGGILLVLSAGMTSVLASTC
ncbi:hypothetical protein Pelo_2381 [Pelomyxa schiedti]|nr:hypothetical protein Pelo_2381 [Pelomyxa schiedti]